MEKLTLKKKLSRKNNRSNVIRQNKSRVNRKTTIKNKSLKGGSKNLFDILPVENETNTNNETNINNNNKTKNNVNNKTKRKNNGEPYINVNKNSVNNKTNIKNNGKPYITVDRRTTTVLDSSPNYISFKIGSHDRGFQEISFKIDEMSVDKLQYYLLKKLLTISDDKIKINDKLFIMDTREKSYSKGGYNLIDVYEDNTVDMLSYNTSLDNFFDINDTTNINVAETIPNLSYNQDIDWLRKIIFDFNYISKENNTDKKRNLDIFLEEQTIIERPIFTKCDLNIVDQTKIIAEKITIGNEVFVICGYPHMSMRSNLKLYEDSTNNALFKSIYSDHKKMMDYIQTLFNFLNPTNKIDTSEQIYKFYEKNNMHLKYLKIYYKNIINNFLKDYKQPLFSTNTEKQHETNNENEINKYLDKKFQDEYNGLIL